MSKTRKKREPEEDYDDFSYEDKRNSVDKRKQRRITRALKLKDLDALMNEDLDWTELDGGDF